MQQHGSRAFCRNDARAFARAAVLFVRHSGPDASYPDDLYYIDIRGVWTDFVAHECAPSYLRPTLVGALTARQQHQLVGYLPAAMAATVRLALSESLR